MYAIRSYYAFDYYSRIAPAYTEEFSEIHRLEPYVYAQMVAGKDAKRFGEAKNSWLTGTASWNFVAISQYILGIKPEYEGLMIDPSIPAVWDGYSVVREFRGTTYKIEIKNPNHRITSYNVCYTKLLRNIIVPQNIIACQIVCLAYLCC